MEELNKKVVQMIKYCLVDGSNIAFIIPKWKNNKKFGRFNLLEKIETFLNKLISDYPSLEFDIIVDANLKYKIDNLALLQTAIEENRIKMCPAGSTADEFIREMLEEKEGGVAIISNDLFRQFPKPLQDKRAEWRFPVMFLNESVIIPSLKERILSNNVISKEKVIDQMRIETEELNIKSY